MNKLNESIPEGILHKINWICHDVYILNDLQVISVTFEHRKEVLRNGSYCFLVNGMYRAKKWIRDNCINIKDFITI